MTTISQKNIVPGVVLAAAVADAYTAPNLTRARVCNATLTNSTAAAVLCSVYIRTGGDAAAAKNIKIALRQVSAGETYTCPEIINRILEPGDSIAALGLGVTLDVSAIIQS